MKIADFDALPISEYTGHPYDPEWGCQIQKPHKRRFRIFRMWKKPQPKQDHPRYFEVLTDIAESLSDEIDASTHEDILGMWKVYDQAEMERIVQEMMEDDWRVMKSS